jgi:hypothetical protein
MKKCRSRFLIFLLAAIAASLVVSRESATVFATRFAAASTAFKNVFEAPIDEPVSSLDVKLTLHSNSFDGSPAQPDTRPTQVRLDSKVTRHFEASPATPARDEVLQSWATFFEARQLIAFSVPDDRGRTRIEFQIAPPSR